MSFYVVRWGWAALLLLSMSEISEGARTARLPRQRMKTYEAGYGSPRGFILGMQVSCLNLDPFHEQKVHVKTRNENFELSILMENETGITGWTRNSPGGQWFGLEHAPSGRTLRTMNLAKRDETGDSKEVYLGYTCAFRKDGVFCDNNDDGIFHSPNWGTSTTLNSGRTMPDDSVDCTTTAGAAIPKCVRKAAAVHEVIPTVEVETTRGAVLCSYYATLSLAFAHNQVMAEVNTYFNGGNPF